MIIIGGRYLHSEELRDRGLKRCGDNVTIHETCTLIDVENMDIGNNVRIDAWSVLSAAKGSIRLGSYVHIGAQCHLAGRAGIEMCDFSGLSQAVRIYSATDDYLGGGLTNPTVPEKYLKLVMGRVTLGRHVIIGSGSVILPDVSIGNGSAVGALSLVKRSLDNWGVYAGVPVKRLRDRPRSLIEKQEAMLS
jgi:galactoside O-acetyltransferase